MTTARSGFTLVELLIVFFIIGTLAGMGTPRLRRALFEADAARVVSDVRVFKLAVAEYHSETGELPPSAGWGQVPPALTAYLPAGFAFEYKDVEYAWSSPDSDAASGAGGESEASAGSGNPGQGRGRGRARGRGQNQGRGNAGAAGQGSGGGGAASDNAVSAEDAGLWVRYPAGSEVAEALRSHNGTNAHWAPAQMLFVIER